jgi:hypothetical protein
MKLSTRSQIGAVALMAALVTTLVGSAPATPAVAYPAPDRFPPVSAATLDQRYTATGDAVRDALAVARAGNDRPRIATLERLAGRDLLEFDPRGHGRAVEVIGELAGADRIAVVVPGSHTTLDTFDRNRGPGGGARALAEELDAIDPATRVAVVAWLGYDTPQGVGPDGITDGLARTGADALRGTVAALHEVNPDAPIGLLCHSYGSVVCAYAVPELPVAELAFYGSPGVGVSSVDDLATSARVWAGRAADDWIRFVPSVRVAGIGFGADPMAPEFGARVFPTGDGGHGDYHLRGGVALHQLALIALGGGLGD